MAGGRKQAGARVPTEGGHAKPGVKGKNFNRAEEEQLCRSVLFVSQDRIVGNQQRAGVFWERITEHYDDHRPDAPRPQRSLETKWGLIKHDVSSFCGVYSQVLRLNKSGTSIADTLRHARELFRQKSAKKAEFAFEHCWAILKDHPKWADGWSSPRGSSSMRTPAACGNSPNEVPEANLSQSQTQRSPAACGHSEGDAGGSQRGTNSRPSGSKAARDESRSNSAREGAIYAQADATRTMAAAQMKKAQLLEDQNMLLLMTMPDDKITTHEAREYLRLRRADELRKLRRKLADEEDRERLASPLVEDDSGRSSATKRRRQGEGAANFDLGEGSQRRPVWFEETAEFCGARRDAQGDGDGGGRGSASMAEEDEGDDGVCVSQTQGGGDRLPTGVDRGVGFAADRGQQGAGFEQPGENSAEVVHCSTEQGAGMWAHTGGGDTVTLGVNSEEPGSFHRSWLDMDRVDPCQPTQTYNVGCRSQQGGSAHWSGAHSGRVHPIHIDRDEYVEQGEDNVDVGLSLQGQFY